MADVKVAILNSGKIFLTQALVGYRLFKPSYFQVAENIGFTPAPGDSVPNGPIVYTGNRLQIQAKQLASDKARYILTIPEGAGPFKIGNIMMFAENEDTAPSPFASIVLPFQYDKVVSDPNLQSSINNAVPIPGNRFVCNITIKHSVDATSMTVEIETPTFSSLGFFANIAEIPAPSMNPWNTFVALHDPRSLTPALVTKRTDDTYWGVPFWQNFRDPNFGKIDGGLVGDGYKADQEGYLWGNSYLTPSSEFSGAIGGSTYDTADADYTSAVGGLSYT